MSEPTGLWDRAGGDPDAPERFVIFTEHVNATYFIGFDIPLAALARRRRIRWWTMGSATARRHAEGAGMGAVLQQIAAEAAPTCIVLTRYALPAGLEILRFFRARGVRCIYHIDDDLLGLSEELGSDVLARHGHPDVVAERRALLGEADLVYGSTAALCEVLASQFPQQEFVTGIYRAYQPGAHTARRSDPVVVGYMGSKGHARDLDIAAPAIARLLTDCGDAVRFELFGTIPFPECLGPWRSSIRHRAATADYFAFRQQLGELGWHIGLAPLADNAFNRCKAPTKFIEYTEAGIVTVASDVAVYRPHLSPADGAITGALCAEGDWYHAILGLVGAAAAREELVAAARSYCEREFALDRLAAQVEAILAGGLASRATAGAVPRAAGVQRYESAK